MIPHNYNNAAGTIQSWDTSDSFEHYQRNLKNFKQRALLQKYGYVDANISYEFNSEGFRGPEISDPECLCFGCSFTMGTGIAQEHTWPSQFSKITSYSVANLGHAGSSNDTAVRFALHYISKIKPKFAIWVQTDAYRLEIIDDDTKIVNNILAGSLQQTPYKNDYYIKQWALHTTNHQINLIKNTLAFEQLCLQHNVICVVISRDQVPNIDLARDLMHPGIKSNKKLAESIAQLV